jgi:mRNA-degrading endonuclease RelE of RelBE toxin-antitoxin system
MAYVIEFAESVKGQLRPLAARDRALLFDAIEKQLLHEPLVETKNRKLLRPNPLAPWELRVGDLRVFYEVPEGEPDKVRILAVGEKRGNTLWIGGKEVQL